MNDLKENRVMMHPVNSKIVRLNYRNSMFDNQTIIISIQTLFDYKTKIKKNDIRNNNRKLLPYDCLVVDLITKFRF